MIASVINLAVLNSLSKCSKALQNTGFSVKFNQSSVCGGVFKSQCEPPPHRIASQQEGTGILYLYVYIDILVNMCVCIYICIYIYGCAPPHRPPLLPPWYPPLPSQWYPPLRPQCILPFPPLWRGGGRFEMKSHKRTITELPKKLWNQPLPSLWW